MNSSVEVEFVYNDVDSYGSEMSELYSYSEEPEFLQSKCCFEDLARRSGISQWKTSSVMDQKRFLMMLQNMLDVAGGDQRMLAVHAVLYLVQGVFGEVESEEEHLLQVKRNVLLIYQQDMFQSFVEILRLEIERIFIIFSSSGSRMSDKSLYKCSLLMVSKAFVISSSKMNSDTAIAALKKPAVSIADSRDLRCILNVLYTLVETMRTFNGGSPEQKGSPMDTMAESFRSDFIDQTVVSDDDDDHCLSVVLLTMVIRFCAGNSPHFPMKKVLLLLWKVFLTSLGGLRQHQQQKNSARQRHGLPPAPDDTQEVCNFMRPASPPASAMDLIEPQDPRLARCAKPSLVKQSGLEELFDSGDDDDDDVMKDIDGLRVSSSGDDLSTTIVRPNSPFCQRKSLPWKPKVRQKDLELFLEQTRSKFVGLQVKNDLSSLAGLPQPIHVAVKVLKEHLYRSMSEVQVEREEEISRNPMSRPEPCVEQTAAESLYRAMLPHLPQYMIALLKLLLGAAPTSKAKTESINILSDVLPELMPTTILQSMKLGIDINRHKEIVVKAISGILLLLLKHFKLSHIYQFEFTSQHLVFANCIPLVLKLLNQNILSYVTAKNIVAALEYPKCVMAERPELTPENINDGDGGDITYCWRNIFSCINLLRLLNKLTKWKHCRTMMLVVFKSAPILKRALKVRQPMLQLYVLKLLKLQTKYLGRQWRKSNMKTLSAIYQTVRHRLGDDWAYGNDIDARPWAFKAEECALRASVDRFNERRYGDGDLDSEYRPVDNCLLSVLGPAVELSDEYKLNYERWLDQEVFGHQVNWDLMLDPC